MSGGAVCSAGNPNRRDVMRVLTAGVLAALACAPASAQTANGGRVELFSQFRFHLEATAWADDDPRFSGSGRFAGDVDVLDYQRGRLNFLADYEVVLGHEQGPFDPNQGLYILEVSASYRQAGSEIAGVLHHVSRHLGDRAKTFPIDWNELGARLTWPYQRKRLRLAHEMHVLAITQRSFVDYRWRYGSSVAARHDNGRRLKPIARAEIELIGVDRRIAARKTQIGGAVEGGVRFDGRGASLELFAGYERRVDAAVLDRAPGSWVLVGFRLISRE